MRRILIYGLVFLPVLVLAASRSQQQTVSPDLEGTKSATEENLGGALTPGGLKPYYVPPLEGGADETPGQSTANSVVRGQAPDQSMTRLETLDYRINDLIQRVQNLDRRISRVEQTLATQPNAGRGETTELREPERESGRERGENESREELRGGSVYGESGSRGDSE